MTGRVIVSIDGKKLSDIEKNLVSHPNTAAILLFTRNFANKEQLRSLISEIQTFAKKDDLPIFVDQEGGQIQRFQGHGFTNLESFKDIGANPSLIQQHAKALTNDLAEFGIISLTPVVDLDLGNSVISGKNRSFSRNPKEVSRITREYITALNMHGHSATLKHFPGHGQLYPNGQDDSHFCLPIDQRDLTSITNSDLIPFIENLSLADAIMPAHILYPNIDSKNTVGFSYVWLEEILRNKYGYKGIIVSDCLSMAGAGTNSMLEKTNNSLELVDIAIMCNISATESLKVLDNLANGQLSAAREPYFKKWTEFGRLTRAELKLNSVTI